MTLKKNDVPMNEWINKKKWRGMIKHKSKFKTWGITALKESKKTKSNGINFTLWNRLKSKKEISKIKVRNSQTFLIIYKDKATNQGTT